MGAIPRVPIHSVPRPSLFGRLDDAAQVPITVVVAPAGSGKSTLVRSWLAAAGALRRAAWVPIERGERDEQRFWSTVVDELRAASPLGVLVETPTPTPNYDADALIERLVDELASLREPLTLVLDDVHEIADADLLRHLAYFLDHLPSALRVVLVSRRDVQLGLHRHRLRGDLAEVRHDDLRFTLDETRQLVEARGVLLSGPRLRLLHERTEGWVAGLLLATTSLAAHPDPERFVVEFSGSERTVAEYLVAEVLGDQPADVRRLLLRASLLARVNGALADLLTGGSGGERQLKELADSGAFVIALDVPGTWFRFHGLFADLLAAELRHTDPEEIPHLHLVAARWFAQQDMPVEAVTHAQAGGDQQLAAGLLLQHYVTLELDGRQASAHALLEAYTLEFRDHPPEIAVVMARDALTHGSLEQAAVYLTLAQRDADRVPEAGRRVFDVAVLLTRLTLAQRIGDFRSVLAETTSAGAVVEPRLLGDVRMNNDVHALLRMNLGIVEVWSGSMVLGVQHLVEARDLARQIGRPYIEVGCLAHWAQAQLWTSFGGAREAAREAIALAEQHGWGADPVVAPALWTLGVALVHAGRLDDGEWWIARADRVLRADLEPAVGYVVHGAYAALHLARGHFEKALASFRTADRLGLQLVSGSALATQFRSGVLFAMFQAGERQSAREALAAMSDAERDAGEIREVTAVVALADGHADAALDALAPTVDGTAPTWHPVVLVRSLILQARAHDARGDTRHAEAALERALDVAEPDTLVLPFLLSTSPDVLDRHPRGRTEHGAFIREILDAMSGAALGPENAPVPAAHDPLSGAERRLLRYLSTHLTAAEVAGELSVSTNTVKTHMRHIYAKLGAHTREEAVARARELGLLGPSARHGSRA